MAKSKIFWAVAALISLGVAVFSGYSVYGRLSLHFSGDTIEMKPSPVPPLADPDKEEAAEAGEKAPPAAAQASEKQAEPEKPKALKTPFEYKDPKAKAVFIAGSFTSWKDVRMKKEDGVWRANIYILPGNYPYHFVVDGAKKTAPGKPSTNMGESLITVTAP
ncbi:MAG TPA: glycogen-binding domain-containing protein [Elusimicrobiales bacterium]|nr:glycogen-binding domain-containing protein [Elusimicrobiales bacterium]